MLTQLPAWINTETSAVMNRNIQKTLRLDPELPFNLTNSSREHTHTLWVPPVAGLRHLVFFVAGGHGPPVLGHLILPRLVVFCQLAINDIT